MTAAAKCLQVILALFNTIFLIIGILIITSSTYAFNASQEETRTIGIALLGVGAASILIGIFGILGTFCRSKAILVFYAVLLCVVFILQIIFGGLTIATSSDTEKVAAYSNVVWEGMNNDLRNAFQKQNKCCGFSLATDRPGDNCSIPWLINPCESYVEASVTSVIRQTGIYAFVSAAVELGAIIIAFILAFDDEKRVQGYGRGV